LEYEYAFMLHIYKNINHFLTFKPLCRLFKILKRIVISRTTFFQVYSSHCLFPTNTNRRSLFPSCLLLILHCRQSRLLPFSCFSCSSEMQFSWHFSAKLELGSLNCSMHVVNRLSCPGNWSLVLGPGSLAACLQRLFPLLYLFGIFVFLGPKSLCLFFLFFCFVYFCVLSVAVALWFSHLFCAAPRRNILLLQQEMTSICC